MMADPYIDSLYWQQKKYYGPEPYADYWNYGGQYRDPSYDALGLLSSPSPQVQALIDQGVISRTRHQGNNEGGQFDYFTDDFNAFHPGAAVMPKGGAPNTNFNWMPIGADPQSARDRLIDPAMVYHDPNYGWLTPTFNDKSNKGDWMDLIGPLIMSVVTLGAGALPAFGAAGAAATAVTGAAAMGGSTAASIASGLGSFASTPWYISAGLSAAKQIGGGNPTALGLATTALPGLSEFGIPSELVTAAKVGAGVYGATQGGQQSQPFYDPTAFGNMGNMTDTGYGNTPAASDGTQRVATSIAPDAYGNSYNQVIT
jgi:hypothetical protein